MASPLTPGALAVAALYLLATLTAASFSGGQGPVSSPLGVGYEKATGSGGEKEWNSLALPSVTAEVALSGVGQDRVSPLFTSWEWPPAIQDVLFHKQLNRQARFVTPSSSDKEHRPRHNHFSLPSWLSGSIDEPSEEIESEISRTPVEAGIEAIFRKVAYGDAAKSYLPAKEKETEKRHTGTTGNRYERTTVLSETPVFDYVSDGRGDSPPGWPFDAPQTPKEKDTGKIRSANDIEDSSWSDPPAEGDVDANKSITNILELDEYDEELYNLYEGHYADLNIDDESRSDISRRGDTILEDVGDQNNTYTNNSKNATAPSENTSGLSDFISQNRYKPTSRLSWFDALMFSSRNMAWVFVNFLLGFLFLLLSFLAPYRLLRLRACTRLLPRTHYVAVHLLVFVAASFKAVYLFHLAFGGKERLPLVLLLILTNTGVPCWSSAFLLLILMMFLAADVQVYKPRLMTVYNISLLIVMKLLLCFIADVIVGSAHSKSVLVISRLMLICVAVIVIVFYIRKHQRVVQVAEILKREFQGEMKLLVVPAQDSTQERRMGIKHILRNRLYQWCKVTKVSAGALATLCFIHFFHSIFLISSQVPAWAWWIFHVCGCLVEFILGGTVFVAAALTQRYDDKVRFLHNFFVPSGVFPKQKPTVQKERNGNAVYQRVSYSSGTESTQYVSGSNDAGPVAIEEAPGSPRVPKRRGATVRRSATFSHTPQDPRLFHRTYDSHLHPHVVRAGSTSQIPIYSPGSVSIYGHASTSHAPIYNPPSTSSMLVHEDGFVRIKTQSDRHARNPNVHESLIRLQDPSPCHRRSHQRLYDPNPQQLNGLGRQESFYESLSRRRGNYHVPAVLHNNIEGPESAYHQTPVRNHSYSPDLPQLHYHGRGEVDYQSLPRRRSSRDPRDPMVKQINNMEAYHSTGLRRNNSRGQSFQAMNNLDRGECEYQNLARRKMSYEDNNDPVHLTAGEPEYQAIVNDRRLSREERHQCQSPYDKHGVNYYLPSHPGSPSSRQKISNYTSAPPQSPDDSSVSIHNFYKPKSPSSPRREAHFPKLYSDLGSTSSLRGEDLDHRGPYPRTNPVRRHNSSAGYFPSRNLALSEISEEKRFSSLRLSQVKKRQPGYAIKSNTSKLLNKYIDLLPRRLSASADTSKEHPIQSTSHDNTETGEKGSKLPESEEESKENRHCEESESLMGKEGNEEGAEGGEEDRSNDPDWALELIKSSSLLTDFYCLESPMEEEENPCDA